MTAAHNSWSHRFVVVATGASTPVGLCAPMTAASVRAGICRHALHPTMLDGAGDPVRAAFAAFLDPDLTAPARALALAVPALQETLEPLEALGRVPLSLAVGLPEERPGWAHTDSNTVMRALTGVLLRSARPEAVTSVPRGHASAFVALELALRDLDAGRTQACVIGGVDTYLDPMTLDWLDQSRRLSTARHRSAFVPGEAASFFVVTTAATARAWRLPELATIRSVATTREQSPFGSNRVITGEALTAAIAGATQPLRLPHEKIATTYCDLNGERHRTDEFLYVPLRLHAPFIDANAYESPADAWGDVGAASGPLYMALAVASAERGYARGPHVLAWTSSDGGTRAAATLTLPTHCNGDR